jgi:hypothetical protein
MNDIKSLLCRHVLKQHHDGIRPLTKKQIHGPWDWLTTSRTISTGEGLVTSYAFDGVRINDDGEVKGYTVMADELRWQNERV